ncbi:MAG: hypothetical protein GX299_02850 [Epulopiscium sp.]|jgi:hypothetical protein|nr:hypothetical protein [Candidatus Epulonipiscium sp.]
MSKKGYLWLAVVCTVIGAISFFVTANYVAEKVPQITQSTSKPEPKVILQQDKESQEKEVSSTTNKIQPYTQMVYQYYYPQDGITKVQEEVPPYFLLDLTLEDVKRLYEDWQIISFSDKKVIMRRSMDGNSDERYILGQQDGSVAVFYEEEKNGISLHELTKIPVSSLPQEDQERLQEGIFVLGDENLSKVLADLGS